MLYIIVIIKFSGYSVLSASISTCVSQCLELDGTGKTCKFDEKSGLAIGGYCMSDFFRPTGIDRRVICVYEKNDIVRGLSLDLLIESKLCTTILVLVTIRFDSKVPTNIRMVIVDEDMHMDAQKISSKPTVKLHYKLGTGMSMNDSMNPIDFSRTFDMTIRRGRWVDAMVSLSQKPEGQYYSGLYIRWLYPGCPNDDCKVGPASDEHMLVKALNELSSAWKSKSPNKVWELAMETSAKADNIYMGLGIELLGRVLHYFLILTYEWSMPVMTTIPPKTFFQTPYDKIDLAIDGYLKKAKRDNKRFFLGINPTLIRYALSDSVMTAKYGKGKLASDEYYVNSSASRYIAFSDACALISNASNNYTVVVPKAEELNKTSYAKSDTTFISFDETNDIIDKVRKIFDKYNNRIGGIWMKNISHDDFTGKICGCGPFPSLRAGNEGLFGGGCTMKKCFTKK
ncbi:Hypothetical predicted protein [Cloeon dipterum]|uniref:GH18 domain-containing protein n=1 Tax=Cloeon dipterum TaxID=197152 RepID=A0A8S1BSU0_9INSE|nr:Hypothetical predicted protein [Cloeon dipterum]